MKRVISGSVTSSNSKPKNAVWVKDGQDMKWKLFKGTNEDSVDSDFLSRVSRKNNANYIDVIVVPNGTHPNEVINSSIEYEEDLPQAEQEYDSAKTSINSNKLPAIYNMITLPKGSVGIDYGGGKFDNAVEALAEQGVTLHVYDPYNRSQQHNRAAIKALRANGGADFAINSNVLNVIKEPEARLNVLENIKKITKPGAPIYITVYEGSGKGNEGVTKSGYQLNRKTADYLEEIQQVFPNAKRRGKLIIATNDTSVNSSTDIKASLWMGKYKSAKDNKMHKVYFEFDTSDFEEAEREFEDIIPEPYSYARLLGTAPYETLLQKDGFEKIQSSSSVEARSYGGAYDVDPEQYFTREDLVEFADDVISCIANSQDILFDVSELYIEGNNITLGLTNTNNGGGFDHTVTFTVDMRKIRNPWDLQTKYSQKIANMFIDEYNKAIAEDEIYSSKQPNSKLNQIRDKITKVVKNVMMFEAGFSEDEVEEYSVVEVDPSGKVEVRAEVDYDGLMSLCDALNPIVQRYDKDSYFEPVQPGIIQAWVNTQNGVIESSITSSRGYWYFTRHGVQPGSVPKYVNILDIVDTPEGSYFLADGVISTNDLRNYEIKERKPEGVNSSSTIQGGLYSYPERPLDPPEDNRWEELDLDNEVIELTLDAIVHVGEDGSWEYKDTNYPWAASPYNKRGDWYTDEYNVYIGDKTSIVEYVDELIEPMMPIEKGDYRIKGDVTLVFSVEGIQVKREYFWDERHGEDYEEESYTDDAKTSFLYDESYIKNFEVTKR